MYVCEKKKKTVRESVRGEDEDFELRQNIWECLAGADYKQPLPVTSM